MGHCKRGRFKGGRNPEARCRIIGIIGAGRGTGVTHLSVLAANYLSSSLQRRTAVIEWNDHGSFFQIKATFRDSLEKRAGSADYGYKIFGVAYYMQGDPRVLARCMDGSYDDIVIDFGEMRASIRAEWLRCTVKIITASLSEWKLKAFMELLTEEDERRTGWIYTAAFGSEDIRREIERQFHILLKRVPLSVDAFSVDYRVMEWFGGIL
ncbi:MULTISPECIES: hypothetical protein [Clostridia]|uniref:Uncharacterized protein n=1 Tax=Enterocloster citroniae TaxID=358743 RepID=A0ABV2FWB8_9FIRM|nr:MULTISPECIES: hypothetical protein [Clostridia]MCB7064106.1 hypothetical protein [Enterocloster citroniae]MCC8087304.1 hypothetical protein [Clostridium sp.]MCD8281282.1 hypothetical protein [Enterocloster citroniae]